MGRKPKNVSREVSRFKHLCKKLRIEYGDLSMSELADRLGYQQARLSHFETNPQGPPLDVVEKYADFFKLESEDRFNFFLAALESSEKIEIDFNKISPTFQDIFRKLLAFVLSAQDVNTILEAGKNNPDYWSNGGLVNPYEELEDKWKNYKSALSNFIKEGTKKHHPLPEKYLAIPPQ